MYTIAIGAIFGILVSIFFYIVDKKVTTNPHNRLKLGNSLFVCTVLSFALSIIVAAIIPANRENVVDSCRLTKINDIYVIAERNGYGVSFYTCYYNGKMQTNTATIKLIEPGDIPRIEFNRKALIEGENNWSLSSDKYGKTYIYVPRGTIDFN